jgi:hypothetical protein
MFEDFPYTTAPDPISVLFHPSAVPVIDVFRSLGSFDGQYDLVLLDGPEQALAAYTHPDTAKGIISDALLLAFALTRQRGRAFRLRPLGSRRGSRDEYCLMTLISSSRFPASELAREAAGALGVAALDFLPSLAGELIRQIDLGSIVFDPPSLTEFRAILGIEEPVETMSLKPQGRPGFNLHV